MDEEIEDSAIVESPTRVIMQLSETLSQNARKLAKLAKSGSRNHSMLSSSIPTTSARGQSSVSVQGEACCILGDALAVCQEIPCE